MSWFNDAAQSRRLHLFVFFALHSTGNILSIILQKYASLPEVVTHIVLIGGRDDEDAAREIFGPMFSQVDALQDKVITVRSSVVLPR